MEGWDGGDFVLERKQGCQLISRQICSWDSKAPSLALDMGYALN